MQPSIFVAVFTACFLLTTQSLGAAQRYTIEAAVNDETFIINGEKFVAKVYCLGGMKEMR